jgi:dihydroorotate dehydrogenase (NAD+) catalytic subunit
MTMQSDHDRAGPALGVEVGRGLRLRNPVIAASGTFGYGLEFAGLVDVARLGAVSVKGISPHPAAGHPAPRIVETPAGMLNAIGLQNVGVREFVDEKLPILRTLGTRIVVNCWGNTEDEYGEVAARLSAASGIDALEVNISSPNKREWGRILATDIGAIAAVIRRVRANTELPVWVKLSPNVTDIADCARAAEDAGADALSLINTLVGMAVDAETRKPLLTNVTGGLSGPAIKPVALHMVRCVAQAVRIPVVGVGGIRSGTDAVEFLLCGARAVQVGTATFYDPTAPVRVVDELTSYLIRHGIDDVTDLVGALEA